jgi:protease PrsW
MPEISSFTAAAAGGILPALAWLWFWRREDSAHPEPRRLIALAFLAGMVAVGVVIPLEKFAQSFLMSPSLFFVNTGPLTILVSIAAVTGSQTFIFTVWSAMEELIKYVMARLTVLHKHEDDEPIDSVIYMVTVALGFAAAENTLFLLSPLSGGTLVQTIMTGDLPFVGATLLHVLSSAVIGVALGLSFYKPKRSRRLYVVVGVILAAALHATFNFLILNTPEEHLLRTFGLVWVGLIVLLAMLEYIKRIHPVIVKKISWRS